MPTRVQIDSGMTITKITYVANYISGQPHIAPAGGIFFLQCTYTMEIFFCFVPIISKLHAEWRRFHWNIYAKFKIKNLLQNFTIFLWKCRWNLSHTGGFFGGLYIYHGLACYWLASRSVRMSSWALSPRTSACRPPPPTPAAFLSNYNILFICIYPYFVQQF